MKFKKSKKRNIDPEAQAVIGNMPKTPRIFLLKTGKTRAALLGVTGVLLLAAGFFWSGYINTNLSNQVSGPVVVCNDQLLQRAEQAIRSESLNIDTLKDLTDEVVQLEDYEKDINCLYVQTKYFILIGDAANARTSFDKLQDVYQSSSTPFNEVLGGGAETPEKLQPEVEFIEAQAERYENMEAFGAPLEVPGE